MRVIGGPYSWMIMRVIGSLVKKYGPPFIGGFHLSAILVGCIIGVLIFARLGIHESVVALLGKNMDLFMGGFTFQGSWWVALLGSLFLLVMGSMRVWSLSWEKIWTRSWGVSPFRDLGGLHRGFHLSGIFQLCHLYTERKFQSSSVLWCCSG